MPVRMSITRALLVALAVFCGACSQESGGGGEDAPVRLRVAMDDTGAAGRLHKEAFAEFTAQTGIEVELLTIPKDATETLSQYRNYFSAKSDDIDVYQIDVIWPGTLGSHLVDLTGKVDAGAFFPPLIENNTVKGKLVALPWWSDAGLLYYRTDLLEKYGYDGPPTTWDELEEMSATIQAGEREERGDNSFWGYLWQGKAYEGLTCNGLEWVKSHGGGTIVDGEGNVTINNEAAAQALDRAAGWVGNISPPGVAAYMEPESLGLFQNGNAAFLRSWPYVWAECQKEGSPVKGQVAVALNPDGGGGHAAALGGWQLAVSKYSTKQDAAIKLVNFLTSADMLKRRALVGGFLPPRVELYDDAEIAEAIPYFPEYRDVLLNATPRPSTVTGLDYNQISSIFFKNANEVLTGQAEGAAAVAAMEEEMTRVLAAP